MNSVRQQSNSSDTINRNGVKADPDKTKATTEMEAPRSVSDLRGFLGLVNQLGKFSPSVAELTQPLRELFSSKCTWLWGPDQEKAYAGIKEELVKPTTLTLYDPTAEVKISADVASFGLGAVLLPQEGGDWKPVAYALRSMTLTEGRYAQIEIKEALAIMWAYGKFSDYVLGRKFTIESSQLKLTTNPSFLS